MFYSLAKQTIFFCSTLHIYLLPKYPLSSLFLLIRNINLHFVCERVKKGHSNGNRIPQCRIVHFYLKLVQAIIDFNFEKSLNKLIRLIDEMWLKMVSL